jgi:Phage portal protein, SPP1 Gp6-like
MPISSVGLDFGRGNSSVASSLGAVPFAKKGMAKQSASLMTLDQQEQNRLRRYEEHWRFYYGLQWAFMRDDGEPLVTLNYFRKMIDKSVAFLMGEGITLNVPPALERVSLPFLEEVWEENNGPDLLFQIGTMGAVTGDAFLLFTMEMPSELDRKINPYTKPKIRINLLGSEWVFPTWDPLNINRMISCRIETVVERADPYIRLVGEDRKPVFVRQTQILTPDETIRFQEQQDQQGKWFRDGIEIREPNPLGEIPIVHIKNISIPGECYGLPDGQDLLALQREFNEKATDISDTVNYHSSPITIIEGARAKQLEKSPKKTWSVPAGARVYHLEYGGSMELSQLYLDRIKKAMHELSDVPENALGSNMAISNTSGVALSMLLRPLIEKTKKKKATYGPGLQRGNYFILRLGVISGQLNLPFDLCASCGGRIVERVVEGADATGGGGGNIERQCYAIDEKTLKFLDPNQVKVKFARTLFGDERIIETEFWRYLAFYRGVPASFWETGNNTARDEAEAQGKEPEPPPPLPTMTQDLQLKLLEVPLEPEVVAVGQKEMLLVPTGCTVHEYLNPWKNTVDFPDPLPRDDKLQADLLKQYLEMQVASKAWVQRQIPVIAKEMAQINREMEQEPAPAKMAPSGPPKQPEFKSKEDIQEEQQKGAERREAREERGEEPKPK